ncbi:lipase family protein [Corallincola luteus]|uniref:Lipase family protein n=1 Tax=Corallincola luteus TaxID=1775177 RepID=A0ABY2AGW5_9GAMM|nr:lipase family protein [Corallincola luteus]TCI01770.1 lipase family protein [Corallincola luteus]
MNTLSPKLAVDLADFAYKSKNIPKDNKNGIKAAANISKQFMFNAKASTLHGISGTVAEHTLNHFTGFGFVGVGRNEGHYKGEIVIAFRGTAGMADTLTDLHCGTTVGPNFQAVHAGFNRTFNSIKKQLAGLLDKMGNKPIHCVGHSLGGALAQLAANWIKKRYKVPVKLYTFGAPRVGYKSFATLAESSLQGVYRATHRSDPIPLVPVWPFVHAGDEYRLSTCVHLTGKAHCLAGDSPGYLETASAYKDYTSMAKGSAANFKAVRLKYENRHHASFTSVWADRIGEALLTLLRKSGQLTAIMAQAAIGGTLTLYDVLARSLVEISNLSKEYAEDCKGLLGHILNFAGKATVTVDKMTYSFIKSVLNLMLTKLGTATKLALATLT